MMSEAGLFYFTAGTSKMELIVEKGLQTSTILLPAKVSHETSEVLWFHWECYFIQALLRIMLKGILRKPQNRVGMSLIVCLTA